jgi:hypothetical protein
MKKRTLIILTFLTIILTSIVSFYQVKPHGISVERLEHPDFQHTMDILRTVAATTHPSGSAANYKVRDYLTKEIAALGLTAEVMPFEVDINERIAKIEGRMAADADYAAYMNRFMKAKGYDEPHSYVRGKFGDVQTDTVTLHNILVKVDAPQTDDGIMFVSHYDSVPTGPGAGDDGIAVASMLAYLQKVMASSPPKNDLYFLFTDGEEQGLLGAYDYVGNNIETEKAKIKAVFNFEARGNQGGLFMFESSKDNYELVSHFNRAVPQPIAFSIATTIYEHMTNDTDFSVFKRAKYDGLNFAMVEGFEHYHASSDTADNLNKDSAYQYMETVFSLGDYFGQLDLATLTHSQKGLFFPFLGLTTIVLPEIVGYLLGFIPLVLALLVGYKHKASGATKHYVGDLGRSVCGLATLAISAVFLPASYLLSIPLTLFFAMNIVGVYMQVGQKKQLYQASIFLIATFMTIVLAVPLMYMIQVTLQTWYITVACVSLPCILIGVYFWTLWRSTSVRASLDV